MIAEFFAKPIVKYGGLALLAVALVAGTALVLRGEFSKGHKAGAAEVTNAVQSETIKTIDAARKSKERTDEEVRRTPYGDRVDQLE